MKPLPAVLVRDEAAARHQRADEVGPHQRVPAGDEHVLLAEGVLPEALADEGQLLACPLVARGANGVEVGAEVGGVEVQVEAEQVDLAPAEGDVQLDPDREQDAEPAGLVEHRAVPPAIGGERVVVGDGEGAHAARRGGGHERAGIEIPVARGRVEVEVGYHPISHYSGAARRAAGL